LDLDNFQYDLDRKKILQIIAFFDERKYSEKKAFIIDKNNNYNIYLTIKNS